MAMTPPSMFIGKSLNWQTRLQRAATPIMEQMIYLMSYTNIILIPILLAIIMIIIILCIMYSKTAKPEIGKSNNIILEIVWIIIPVVILFSICGQSLKILKYQMNQKRSPFMTIKVTAHQWYWNYEYNIPNKFDFNSNMLKDEQRRKLNKTNTFIYPSLLATDYELVIPERRVIRLLITSADVIHGFAIPSFGIKTDAVPGKITDTWIKVNNTGIYYGQCSEFCGKDHAFMPIAIRVVTQERFNIWLKSVKHDFNNAYIMLNKI